MARCAALPHPVQVQTQAFADLKTDGVPRVQAGGGFWKIIATVFAGQRRLRSRADSRVWSGLQSAVCRAHTARKTVFKASSTSQAGARLAHDAQHCRRPSGCRSQCVLPFCDGKSNRQITL
jgi:hypothetical protein